jgi:hypothetical protein
LANQILGLVKTKRPAPEGWLFSTGQRQVSDTTGVSVAGQSTDAGFDDVFFSGK